MSDPTTSTAGGSTHGLPIELEQVSKRYDGHQDAAVDDLTMTFPAGEIVVLVGPSGCGKTTTMRLINRLIDPTAGRIRIGGEDVRDKHPDELRRSIGYVIQQAGLFPHMTVGTNVGLVPRMLGWTRQRIAERADELLELVGLPPGEFRGRYPRQLSGGQQQRVGVARALAADPPIMLMDEPFGALDPVNRARLQVELLALHRRLGKTIVFVTHDMDEAITVGDRIAVLASGSRLAQYGSPSEILANPADEYVAQFLGAGVSVKLLNLSRVEDVALDSVVEIRADDDVQTARSRIASAGDRYAIVLDERRRPTRWVTLEDLGGNVVGPLSGVGRPIDETIPARATLHQALDGLLRSERDVVAVTGASSQYMGVVTLATVQQAVQQGAVHDRETSRTGEVGQNGAETEGSEA